MRLIAALALIAACITNPTSSYALCPTEDAAGPCVWIAPIQGNGEGSSFIVTADQTVIYID